MSIKSKSARLALVAATALAATIIHSPTAHAEPTICMTEAWAACDPQYVRGTPEWQVCFGEAHDACEAMNPIPPDGPPRWPVIGRRY